MVCRCACRTGRSASATSISSCSTAWVTRGCSRSSSPAIRGAPISPATTRCKKTRSSRRTCWATPTSRRTTRCSSAARSRSVTASSSRRPPTRARSARPSSSTARRASSRCSMRRSRSRRTSIRSRACAASAIRSTSTARARGARKRLSEALRQAARRARRPPTRRSSAARAPIPPAPERDLLWFIAEYAPELEEWERDIFRAVREESFYFYPVFACQIMNEGWASYWHARLLREADFLPQNEYLDALKTHSDVVRPHAAEQQASLVTNPYHLGFSIWESIVEEHGHRARVSDSRRGRRLQLRAQPPDAGARRGAQAVPLRAHSGRRRARARPRHRCAARDRARAEVQLRCAGGAREARRQRRLADALPRARHRRPRARPRARRARARLSAQDVARPIRLETVDASGQARTLSRAA